MKEIGRDKRDKWYMCQYQMTSITPNAKNAKEQET